MSVRQYTPGARELWGRVRKYCEKEIAFEAKSKWRWGGCLRGKQYLLRAPEHEKGVPEEKGWMGRWLYESKGEITNID